MLVLIAGSRYCKFFILALVSVCAIDLLCQSPGSWWHKWLCSVHIRVAY